MRRLTGTACGRPSPNKPSNVIMKDGDRHRPVTVSFSSGNPALGSRTAQVIAKTRQLMPEGD